MMETIRSVRPAGAAIAAVLAFGATSSFAQETGTPAATVIQVPAPEISAPAAAPGQGAVVTPTFTPSQPVVQPTQSVEDRLNASIAAAEAEVPAPVAREARPQPAATRPATRTAAETRQATPSASEAPLVEAPAPMPPASVTNTPPAAVEAPAAPVATPEAGAAPDPMLVAALGGGALLLAGLAGVAVTRRRRGQREEVVEPTAYTAPLPERATMPAAAPLAAKAMPAPSVRPEPAIRAAAPMAHLPADERLHAMVAAPPNPENPFRTHKKRMTRAKFLLAQQERAGGPAENGSKVATAPARQLDQVQTVYRFGSDRGKSPNFRPRTN